MQAPAIANSVFPMELREFKLFRTLIHERTGIWLHDGKQMMLAARLSRRLRHHSLVNFAAYYLYIQGSRDSSQEIVELINCVTTNKTSFFRELHHFDFLANTVVRQIQSVSGAGASRNIRVWSAACSTGEEPYSIAMTLLEALRPPEKSKVPLPLQAATTRIGRTETIQPPGSWKIEVVASDIDTKVLETAVRGVYPEDSLATVNTQLHRKYFLRGRDDMQGYMKVKPDLARMVQFKRINLMDSRWPLDGTFDVIFFRNALIYFNQETQDVFLRKMALYLKPGGYLFLGNSEHIPWLSDILAPLNQTMYRLRDVAQ